MMPWLEAMPAWPGMALIALLLSRLMVLPGTRVPFSAFALILQRLAKKVHPDITRSHFQQQLSGTLALLLVVLLPLAITYGFYLLSELPLVLDAIILYFCLGSRLSLQQGASVAFSLQRQQLTLAKEQAAPLLLRDRQNLSAMGLSKACIESLLQQQAANLVATLCWFLMGGGLLVLTYTLLQTAARQWNSKLPHYRYFGRGAARCYQLALAPGLIISALLLAIQTGIGRAWRNYRQADTLFYYWPSRLLLAAGAAALGVKLGGPAYYDALKTPRQRFGDGVEPASKDILRAILLINAQQTALIILLSSMLALYIARILLLI
ncbi:cobalamin biosynthesis protein CobD/CbiB [Arsukibacterium sp. UBA3155]|uniref:cobalamin biosynthesis protein CobD/CbiB n=1 Tax=Arsukibacterium sp. UBA3155 TaxID=1946058 RepID=UPI0025C62EA3|nr:cobalamin biosynthesis protein [Arsukibacterium sp. UBA3155]|tara:strand:- start:198137 stop:199102 length:966 start_codon:yes stop_codon:yes gene_type:complete